jgi:hypothetical protein
VKHRALGAWLVALQSHRDVALSAGITVQKRGGVTKGQHERHQRRSAAALPPGWHFMLEGDTACLQ